MNERKVIIYVDMDDTLCLFRSAYDAQLANAPHIPFPQSVPGFFVGLEALPGAVETCLWLESLPNVDVYILTAPSVKNLHCYSEKAAWIKSHLGEAFLRKLIISPNKGLNKGDYLIDDCDSGRGQEAFEGTLIQIGTSRFPDWASIRRYFEAKFPGCALPSSAALQAASY